jgi:CMP-N-acetylneuraminic acid synthetase
MIETSNKFRILGITLARGGSKSVPQKNIRPVLGTPLIAYTIAEAKRSQFISRYIVSTDSEEIKQVAKQYGAEVPFMRPDFLSTDTATSADAIKHAVAWVEEEEGQKYDYIVELMCTNPLKTVEDIDAAIRKLIDTGADSVIGMNQLEDHHPARIKKIVDDRIFDFCVPETSSRRQDLKPEAYIRNGSIYALTREVLMDRGKRFGTKNSRPHIMSEEHSVNVDTPLDFLIAEILLKDKPRPYVKQLGEEGIL